MSYSVHILRTGAPLKIDPGQWRGGGAHKEREEDGAVESPSLERPSPLIPRSVTLNLLIQGPTLPSQHKQKGNQRAASILHHPVAVGGD